MTTVTKDRDWAVAELVAARWEPGDAILVVDGLIGQVMPSRGFRTPMTPEQALTYAEEFGLMDRRARFGWIDIEGRFFGCVYAAHERLLDAIGIETPDAETAGWVRLGVSDAYQSNYRLTTAQVRSMRGKGYSPDASLEIFKKPRPAETDASGPQP